MRKVGGEVALITGGASGMNLLGSFGVFNGIHEFVPRIRADGEGGHVVTTSSMGGIFTAATAGTWNAAKYALVSLMESLCPGFVRGNNRWP
jgi:NAD(P)-dependent dehydrogenase (short-subunit alcohol dehydrogenase family)